MFFLATIKNKIIKVIIDIKEDIETICVKVKTNTNITVVIKNNSLDIPNRVPKKVATPFPPLNFKKIDLVCPNIAKNITR